MNIFLGKTILPEEAPFNYQNLPYRTQVKSIGVSDSLLSLLESFVRNRFQRVLLNGQRSQWLPVNAGVPLLLQDWKIKDYKL